MDDEKVFGKEYANAEEVMSAYAEAGFQGFILVVIKQTRPDGGKTAWASNIKRAGYIKQILESIIEQIDEEYGG